MNRFFSLPWLICLILQCPISSYSWQNLDFLGSNSLRGPLPPSLCGMANLKYLILSDNQLTGTIPECLANMSTQLTVLDLRRNKFHGNIPTSFPTNNTLRNLGLNGNHLTGSLPRSLLNCTSLEVLDVGHNNIEGIFPSWLGTLPELSVLILKGNQFQGPISIDSSRSFQKLRILDISQNQFNGTLPATMIDAFQAMKKKDDDDNNNNDTQPKYMGDSTYYDDSVTLIIKGLEMELKRVLTILTTIDLSENRFVGSIPPSIGELNSLKILNLSHNHFDGKIPPTIGQLAALESLDLSDNQLSGKIPPEMERLTFLAFLNLSQNQLTGRIPSGNQFVTFNYTSYSGNPGLCGSPLKDCAKPPVVPPKPLPDDHLNGLTWESVVMGFGCGLILGLFMGSLMLYTHKPKWFHEIVTDLYDKPKRRRIEVRSWSRMRRAN